MISGIQYEQGEIIIVPFPFTDLSTIKQRPVLILSNNYYNNSTQDLITCGITLNIQENNTLLINNEDLANGEIPLTSRIKVDKLFTLHKSIVKKKLGKINVETFAKVKEELFNLI